MRPLLLNGSDATTVETDQSDGSLEGGWRTTTQTFLTFVHRDQSVFLHRFVHKLPVQCFIINGNESSQEEGGIFIFCLPYIAICIKLKAIEKVILHFCYVLSFKEMCQATYSLEQLFLLHFVIGIINLHFIMFFMLSIINLLCFTLLHCNIDDIELLV